MFYLYIEVFNFKNKNRECIHMDTTLGLKKKRNKKIYMLVMIRFS